MSPHHRVRERPSFRRPVLQPSSPVRRQPSVSASSETAASARQRTAKNSPHPAASSGSRYRRNQNSLPNLHLRSRHCPHLPRPRQTKNQYQPPPPHWPPHQPKASPQSQDPSSPAHPESAAGKNRELAGRGWE